MTDIFFKGAVCKKCISINHTCHTALQ